MRGVAKGFQYALVALGLVQIAAASSYWLCHVGGYETDASSLIRVGMASAASPLPVVFCEISGLEHYALDFHMTFLLRGGGVKHFEMDRARYAQLSGPHPWREAYAAAISFAPLLPEPVWRNVLQHGLCDGGLLAKDLGVTEHVRKVDILVTSRKYGEKEEWHLEVDCPDK